MHGVMPTPLAILFKLETIRIVLLVLFGRVIAALAISARQSDQRTHEFSFTINHPQAFNYTHECLLKREDRANDPPFNVNGRSTI